MITFIDTLLIFLYDIQEVMKSRYIFSQNRKNFYLLFLKLIKKSSTFLSKLGKKNDNFENELLCNSLLFPNKEF
jgi:phage regulator Rha-like protein